MKKIVKYRKYEILLIDLEPVKSSIQAGTRPCLVIQTNLVNEYSPNLIVIPFTTNTKKIFSGEIMIKPSDTNGLSSLSKLLSYQIVTVNKNSIIKKMGLLEESFRKELLRSLDIVLDREDEFEI